MPNTAAALLTLSTFLAAIVRGAAIAKVELIPGVGNMSADEVKAAARAARNPYLAGNRPAAITAAAEIIGDEQEAANFLTWLETL